MAGYPKETLKSLIEGTLDWPQTFTIITQDKDADRFEKYIEILQEKLGWSERILLKLTEHLYIVEKGGKRIVKCDCGQEFGDYRVNWKLSSLIHIRETDEELNELWPGDGKPDPKHASIREYFCPGCAALLQVECVPVGYPVIFDFLPDLDTFYADWLGKPLAKKEATKDLTYDHIKTWAKK